MLKRIHVNQHVIRANRRDGADEPPLSVKTYKANFRAHDVAIAGPSRVVYSPNEPLSCGARVWIETSAPVSIVVAGARTVIP